MATQPPLVSVQIEVDPKQAIGWLGRLSDQMPFATSKAINACAIAGQTAERAHIHQAFIVRRGPFIDRTVKIKPFANKHRLEAKIAIDPARDVLAKFEAGGTKYPRSGATVAIPTAVVRPDIRKVVPKSKRIKSLHFHAVRTKHGAVQIKGDKRTFIVKGRNHKGNAVAYVLQRFGRTSKRTVRGRRLDELGGGSQGPGGRDPHVRVLYSFRRSVPIPADLQFHRTIQRVVETRWDREMRQAFEAAVRSAR